MHNLLLFKLDCTIWHAAGMRDNLPEEIQEIRES